MVRIQRWVQFSKFSEGGWYLIVINETYFLSFLLTMMKVMWQLQNLFTQKSFMSPFSLIFLDYKDVKDKILFSQIMWPGSKQWDWSHNNQMRLLGKCLINCRRIICLFSLCLPLFFSSVPRHVIAILQPWKEKSFTKNEKVSCDDLGLWWLPWIVASSGQLIYH